MKEKSFFNGLWQVEEEIGSGATGTVYKVVNAKGGVKSYSAVKETIIPKNKNETKRMYSQGATDSDIDEYYDKQANEWVSKEVSFLEQFKGNPNIVAIEDHDVLPREDVIGRIIIIRMELLETLEDYILSHKVTDKDIIKMGLDILNALEDCEEKNVLHRDIKPQNIFVNKNKIFKLGDFSESKEIEKTVSNMTQRGTPNYMAPELYKGERGSKSLDIYSLGIVLYECFNNNRLPFQSDDYKYEDAKEILDRRMNGEELPSPINASSELSSIILKACSYQPEDRYQSAMDFRDDLKKIYKEIKKPKVLLQPQQQEKKDDGGTLGAHPNGEDMPKAGGKKRPNGRGQFGDDTVTPEEEEEKVKPRKGQKIKPGDTLGAHPNGGDMPKAGGKKRPNGKGQFGDDTVTPEEEKEKVKLGKGKKPKPGDTLGIHTNGEDFPKAGSKKKPKGQFGDTLPTDNEPAVYEEKSLEDQLLSKEGIFEIHQIGDLEYKIFSPAQKEKSTYYYSDKYVTLDFSAIENGMEEDEYEKSLLESEVSKDRSSAFEKVNRTVSYDVISEKDIVINDVIWKEFILSHKENDKVQSVKINGKIYYAYRYIYYRLYHDVYYKVEIQMYERENSFNMSFLAVILSYLKLNIDCEDPITDDMEKARTVSREQINDAYKLTTYKYKDTKLEEAKKEVIEQLKKEYPGIAFIWNVIWFICVVVLFIDIWIFIAQPILGLVIFFGVGFIYSMCEKYFEKKLLQKGGVADDFNTNNK